MHKQDLLGWLSVGKGYAVEMQAHAIALKRHDLLVKGDGSCVGLCLGAQKKAYDQDKKCTKLVCGHGTLQQQEVKARYGRKTGEPVTSARPWKRPCVVLGGFEDTRLCEKRAAPGRGKIRWRRAFLQKDAPWCMRVRIGRWGQECKWENLGEKDRISIVAIVFSLIEIHYFYKKVVRYTVS